MNFRALVIGVRNYFRYSVEKRQKQISNSLSVDCLISVNAEKHIKYLRAKYCTIYFNRFLRCGRPGRLKACCLLFSGVAWEGQEDSRRSGAGLTGRNGRKTPMIRGTSRLCSKSNAIPFSVFDDIATYYRATVVWAVRLGVQNQLRYS